MQLSVKVIFIHFSVSCFLENVLFTTKSVNIDILLNRMQFLCIFYKKSIQLVTFHEIEKKLFAMLTVLFSVGVLASLLIKP